MRLSNTCSILDAHYPTFFQVYQTYRSSSVQCVFKKKRKEVSSKLKKKLKAKAKYLVPLHSSGSMEICLLSTKPFAL